MKLACPECGSSWLKRKDGIYECWYCKASFAEPARVKGLSPWTIVLIGTMTMVAITVVLMAYLYTSVVAMKPAIYLYTRKEEKERLRLKVQGTITTRKPFRTGVRSVTWDGLTLKDGKILDRGMQYDYLFYESENVVPRHDGTGWVLGRKAGKTTWNGRQVDREALTAILSNILEKYGLFENEIADFIEYWLGSDMKIFFGRDDFTYAIYPVPQDELDRIFAIETDLEYPERIRVQFLVKEIGDGETLEEPEYPEIVRSEYALHEWGIIKG